MPQYNSVQFCRNVRELRLHHQLSVSEMADILELTEELLLLLETGVLTDEMDIRLLYHIHQHFGITPNQIISSSLFP